MVSNMLMKQLYLVNVIFIHFAVSAAADLKICAVIMCIEREPPFVPMFFTFHARFEA